MQLEVLTRTFGHGEPGAGVLRDEAAGRAVGDARAPVGLRPFEALLVVGVPEERVSVPAGGAAFARVAVMFAAALDVGGHVQ